MFDAFSSALYATLWDLARDPVVVGFKSVVCYRTGLNVSVNHGDSSGVERSIVATISSWRDAEGSDALRLADKALNDFVVRAALSIATESNKPGECTSIHDHTTSERRRAFVQSNSTPVSVMRTSPSHYPLQPTCNQSSRRTQRQHSSFSMAVIPTPVMRGISHPYTKMSTLISERFFQSLVDTASALS